MESRFSLFMAPVLYILLILVRLSQLEDRNMDIGTEQAEGDIIIVITGPLYNEGIPRFVTADKRDGGGIGGLCNGARVLHAQPALAGFDGGVLVIKIDWSRIWNWDTKRREVLFTLLSGLRTKLVTVTEAGCRISFTVRIDTDTAPEGLLERRRAQLEQCVHGLYGKESPFAVVGVYTADVRLPVVVKGDVADFSTHHDPSLATPEPEHAYPNLFEAAA